MSQEWKQEANFLLLFLFPPPTLSASLLPPLLFPPLPLLHEFRGIPQQNLSLSLSLHVLLYLSSLTCHPPQKCPNIFKHLENILTLNLICGSPQQPNPPLCSFQMGLYTLVWASHWGLSRRRRCIRKKRTSASRLIEIGPTGRWEVLGLWLKWVIVDKECLQLCVLLGPKSLLIYCLGDILECTHDWGCFHWSADGLACVPGSRRSSCYLRLNRRKGKRTFGVIRWIA